MKKLSFYLVLTIFATTISVMLLILGVLINMTPMYCLGALCSVIATPCLLDASNVTKRSEMKKIKEVILYFTPRNYEERYFMFGILSGMAIIYVTLYLAII
jgi:Zn-dependent membrane protease YugP